MADYFFDEDESNDDIEVRDDIYNYKGYFVENEEDEEKKFYEFGAHFPYKYLYQRLEIIAQERAEEQKALEEKLKEKEKESRDDPATNSESKPSENLKDLLCGFQQKGKSRNRGDVGIGLTYMPKMNKKNNNRLNEIENVEINLIKSTAGQNKNNEKRNIMNINANKNVFLNNINNINSLISMKNNSSANKKEKTKSKNKIQKNAKMPNKQIKIRKRNVNNILNINNSLNSNTVSINILNKTKLGDKINSKNMTHDLPYSNKINNNLVDKLKSIQYSKEKLRKQILNTGNIDQRLNKKIKMNVILNKYRNMNNKWNYSKCHGYQNTKNASSSKNVLSKNKNKKKAISKTGIASAHQQNKKSLNENSNKSNIISNINSNHNILNNNIKSIKEINYINNIKNNIILNNNPSNKKYNNKKIQQKIPNNNNSKYKSILNDKLNNKPLSGQRKNIEFIENIGIKKNKNNISRNNNMPLFNNQSQNITNKNFHSVSNAYNNKYIKNTNATTNQIINFNNNFGNLTQQLNQKKEKNIIYNKKSISNASLKKYAPSSFGAKKNTDLNLHQNQSKNNEMTKKKINIINIQEKIKNYLNKNKDVKSTINLNKNINKPKNISLYKNNCFMKGNKNSGKKNILSRNRNENNNSNEKITGRSNNTLLQNKKKNHININININNQHNYILNKMNGINNNSINLCSVRSSDNKGMMNIKKDRNMD